jgi:hypothetical protein
MEARTLGEAVERDIAVIAALHTHVPDEVYRDFPGINTCILTARIVLDLLKHYKVSARVVPVQLAIFNEKMVARIGREGRFPKDVAESEKWAGEDGSWGLATGYTGQMMGNSYDGHLVVLVHYNVRDDDEDIGGILLDLTIQQQSRPHRGIILEPLIATVPERFLSGEQFMASCNNVVVKYVYFPESMVWTQAADWRDSGRRDPIIARIRKKVDRELAAKGLLDG